MAYSLMLFNQSTNIVHKKRGGRSRRSIRDDETPEEYVFHPVLTPLNDNLEFLPDLETSGDCKTN